MLIVGLGNPGPRYAGTRHNVGFELIDVLARRWNVAFELRSRFALGYEIAAVERNGRDLWLVKPLTYMNRSGLLVRPLLAERELSPAESLVAVDDLALEVGMLRFRPRGSAGGHNGLASIESCLDTDEYPRVRLGIGPPPLSGDRSEFVLDRFESEERDVMNKTLHRAADGVDMLLSSGIERAMSAYNG